MELSRVHTEKDCVEDNMEDLGETFGEKLVTLAEPIWEIQKRAKEKKVFGKADMETLSSMLKEYDTSSSNPFIIRIR